MPNPGRHILCLLILAIVSGRASARADDPPDASAASAAARFKAAWNKANAELIDVKTTSKVTRRFEIYNPHSREELATVKRMGFDQVILDWPNLHADATELGLDVVMANWWIDKTPEEDIEKGVEQAKQVNPKRLVGFSIMDEPGRNAPDTPFGFYIDLYKTLRPRFDQELPGVRIEISHWGPMATWNEQLNDYFAYLYEAADVMRIMPYPDLQEGPLNDVYFMMQRSRKLMKTAERELPLLVILQAWVLPPKGKLPQIAELRVMAYQAMLGGAETVSFFDYNTEVWAETPGFHDGFTQLMGELRLLSDRLADASIVTSMDADGVLHADVTRADGSQSTILVNTNRVPAGGLEALAIAEISSAPQLFAGRGSHSAPSCNAVTPGACCPTPAVNCGRRLREFLQSASCDSRPGISPSHWEGRAGGSGRAGPSPAAARPTLPMGE